MFSKTVNVIGKSVGFFLTCVFFVFTFLRTDIKHIGMAEPLWKQAAEEVEEPLQATFSGETVYDDDDYTQSHKILESMISIILY